MADGRLNLREIYTSDPGALGTALRSLDAGGKEWHVAAYKTASNTWDDALATAFTLASPSGGRVVFPPWAVVDLHHFVVPAGVELYGEGATLRRAATYDTSVRHWITLSDGASVDGVVTLDGNSGAVNHTGAQSGLCLAGDDAYVGRWVYITGFTTGSCYCIDVYGDNCEVNGTVEGASYASLRLSAHLKRLRYFEVGHFRSIDAVHKGFVYNGQVGIDHVHIDTMLLSSNSQNVSADGFLTDSETANDPVRIDRLTINFLDIDGWQSNAAKIENVGKFEVGRFRSRGRGDLVTTGSGLMCRAHDADIDFLDSDGRAVFEGSARVGVLRTTTDQQHALQVYGLWGSQIDIGTLDVEQATNWAAAVRVEAAGRPLRVRIGRYIPSVVGGQTNLLYEASAPQDATGYLQVDQYVPYNQVTNQTITRQCAQRTPRQFIGIAPPDSRAWLRGDITYNANPQSGAPLGWVCVAAGEPGTWLPFGVIG